MEPIKGKILAFLVAITFPGDEPDELEGTYIPTMGILVWKAKDFSGINRVQVTKEVPLGISLRLLEHVLLQEQYVESLLDFLEAQKAIGGY